MLSLSEYSNAWPEDNESIFEKSKRIIRSFPAISYINFSLVLTRQAGTLEAASVGNQYPDAMSARDASLLLTQDTSHSLSKIVISHRNEAPNRDPAYLLSLLELVILAHANGYEITGPGELYVSGSNMYGGYSLNLKFDDAQLAYRNVMHPSPRKIIEESVPFSTGW